VSWRRLSIAFNQNWFTPVVPAQSVHLSCSSEKETRAGCRDAALEGAEVDTDTWTPLVGITANASTEHASAPVSGDRVIVTGEGGFGRVSRYLSPCVFIYIYIYM
jgi:hypothetical protein